MGGGGSWLTTLRSMVERPQKPRHINKTCYLEHRNFSITYYNKLEPNRGRARTRSKSVIGIDARNMVLKKEHPSPKSKCSRLVDLLGSPPYYNKGTLLSVGYFIGEP